MTKGAITPAADPARLLKLPLGEADTLRTMLVEDDLDASSVTEDCLENWFDAKPTKAWVIDDLVIFVHKGKICEVGFR